MVINSHTLSLGAQALILSGFDKPKVKDADSRSGSTWAKVTERATVLDY